MRNRIAAAAAAGILTIGMAALPSAASASEVAPSTDGLAGSTTISGQIDQDMVVCTDKTCDAVQHVRKTNQQIKSDIDTAKQHAEQPPVASVVHRGAEGRELQDGSAGRLIRCYRHAWHHGWNECRYDRYWSQRHHWHCAHGCRHWREWCCNWIRRSFRRSNRRVHRRADQVGIWTACTNRHRHFPCLRSHSAACRPCLRHEDVRAV